MSLKNSKFLNYSKKYNIIKKIYFFYNIFIRNYKYFYKNSQFGEDKIILNLFPKNFVGNFIDIGCYHPTKYNNTYLFYRKGWRGINIDLNPLSIELFNYLRPGDTNICAAVSNTEGKKTFFFTGDLSPENSIEKSYKFFLKNNFNISPNDIKEKKIKAFKLQNILNKYSIKNINLLSIDIEGHELKVLRSLNLRKIYIDVICVEILSYNSTSKKRTKSIIDYLKKNGYFLKTKTRVNYIFKKK